MRGSWRAERPTHRRLGRVARRAETGAAKPQPTRLTVQPLKTLSEPEVPDDARRYTSRWHLAEQGRWAYAHAAFEEPFAVLMSAVMVLVLGRVLVGGSVLLISMGLLALALGAAVLAADWRMGARVVMVVLSGQAYAVVTALDLWRGETALRWFPLSYLNAQRADGRLQVVYHDRVLTIDPGDWGARYAALEADLLSAEAPLDSGSSGG